MTARRREREVARGLAELEGYLLCQAELRGARAEAEAFVERLPWLTAAQRTEVVRVYTEERLALARRMLHQVTERCHALRQEYAQRYALLRRRLYCRCTALLVAAGSLVVAVLVVVVGTARPGG